MHSEGMYYESRSDGAFEATSIGELLRSVREKRGLSLKEIAKKTRIHMGILVNLEKNNISLLPAKTYVKGFVKALAALLGIEQRKAMELLEAAYYQLALDQLACMPPPTVKPENIIVKTFAELHFTEKVPKFTKAKMAGAVALAMIAMAFGGVSYYVSHIDLNVVTKAEALAPTEMQSEPRAERIYKPMASYPPPAYNSSTPMSNDITAIIRQN